MSPLELHRKINIIPHTGKLGKLGNHFFLFMKIQTNIFNSTFIKKTPDNCKLGNNRNTKINVAGNQLRLKETTDKILF